MISYGQVLPKDHSFTFSYRCFLVHFGINAKQILRVLHLISLSSFVCSLTGHRFQCSKSVINISDIRTDCFLNQSDQTTSDQTNKKHLFCTI